MNNKGTTKIKAISRRALEIREKAGFTTETIVKKRYRMAYVPDAIKQAAKELKTPGTEPLRRKLVSLEELKRQEAERIKEMKTKPKFTLGDKVISKNSTLSNPRTITDRKFQSGIYFYEIQKGNFWKESDLILFVPKSVKSKPLAKPRTVKTKQLSRRAGQSTKAGVKVVKAGISEKVTPAIRAIIKDRKFKDLSFPDAQVLYSLKKSAGKFEYYDNFENLVDNDYIERITFTEKYKVTKSGAEFIKLVDQHIKNAKTDKFNPRLFK